MRLMKPVQIKRDFAFFRDIPMVHSHKISYLGIRVKCCIVGVTFTAGGNLRVFLNFVDPFKVYFD